MSPRQNYATILSKFIKEVQYEDLDKAVINKVKMHFLDCVGICIAAYDYPWSKKMIKVVNTLGGNPESSIFGDCTKTSSILAALVNGTLAHGIDIDDSSGDGWGHPGSSQIPAAMAVAEALHSSGKELITAIVVGYDICCRVDAATYPGLRQKGFHATAVTGAFGAAAAVGKLYKLNVEEITNALGLAGTQAAGLEEWLFTGDMSKRMHAGKAAMNGIMAALLAREGFSGPSTVFEGKYGFCNTHTNIYNLNRLTELLGEKYEIMHCKIKPFACCHEVSGPVRLALGIVNKYDIKPEEIEKISIGLNKTTAENTLKVAINPLQAQNHPAVAVAIALVKREVFVKEFFEDFSDPAVAMIGNKVEIFVDPDIEKAFPQKVGTRLIIYAKGREYSLYEEEWPEITDQFIKEKFIKLVDKKINRKLIDEIIETILNLDEIKNIGQLACLLGSVRKTDGKFIDDL